MEDDDSSAYRVVNDFSLSALCLPVLYMLSPLKNNVQGSVQEHKYNQKHKLN